MGDIVPDSIIQQPLAIVSMSCRLPAADSIEAYWQLLVEGRSAVHSLSDRVLNRTRHFDSRKGVRGKTYTDVGGLVPARPLNRKLLRLSDKDLEAWDECHLIFAEVAAQAWKASMGSQAYNSDSKVGVYIGHSGGSRTAGELIYSTMAKQTADLLRDSTSFSKLGLSSQQTVIDSLVRKMQNGRPVRGENGKPYLEASAAARLVAEVLELNGPRMVLDAACASSLVALGLAALDLQSGSIEAAIVGGASYNKVDSLILFSQAQSCSATASRPFDEAADGLISSEGYIALVIKTLDRAIDDGDTIHGVLRGLGVATDGRGKSLWAPRREGQTLAMKRAYPTAADAKRVQFVEAHATSTQVGDATETQALADFFGQYHQAQSLPVGSVKSNIGHTLETAGLAGLLKTILSMKNKTIPPTINLVQPSSSIDWAAVPFNVPTRCLDWPKPIDGSPRCGAVNAFGIGGLNVHVVVEEYQDDYHKTMSTRRRQSLNNNNLKASHEPIAIVGYGVIIPGAQSSEQLSRLISSQQSKIVEPPSERWRNQPCKTNEKATVRSEPPSGYSPTTTKGGYLLDYAYDWKKHRVPPKQVDRANPLQFMLLDAAGQALDPYLSNGKTIHQERTSVIVGTIFGGEFGHQLQLGLRLCELQDDLVEALHETGIEDNSREIVNEFTENVLKTNPALLDETGSFTSSTLASRITKQFNLMGGAMAIDSGDGSSEAALVTATEMLRSNVSDMVLCAAGQRAMDLPSFLTWESRGQLSDASNAQQLPAEGAVVLLLKRHSDAIQSGDTIHGIIHEIEQIDRRSENVEHRTPSAAAIQAEQLIRQVGDLKSAQLLVSIAATLSAEHISEGQIQVLRSSRSSSIAYEILVSRGSTVLPSANVPQAENDDTSKQQKGQMNRSLVSTISKSTKRTSTLNDWTDKAIQRPCITAVFPGQGSQSAAMIDSVLAHSSAAGETLRLADATLVELGSASFSQLSQLATKSKSSSPSESVWAIQSTMLIADLVYASWMFEQGIRPDLIVGHSLGELAAMVVAGIWSLPESLRFVHARANAVVRHADLASGLLSINRGADEVQTVLNRFSAPVVLTHDNSPDQCVVGGKLSYLKEFQSFIATQRWSTFLLNVPAAFHTLLMVDAQHALVDEVQNTKLRPAAIPLLSSVNGRFVCDPAELRRNLLSQLTSPVVYRTCVETAFRSGSTVFIEVGPSSVLTKLNSAILKGCGVACIAMETNADLSLALDNFHAKRIDLPGKAQDTHSLLVKSESGAAMHKLPSAYLASQPKVTSFDATAKRRQKHRDQAATYREAIKQPIVPAPPPTSASDAVDATVSSSELEAFVRDFIVEHTGYPAEMIEPDWDLEADLGIDSIKQAQLFGELRELFDIDLNQLASGEVRTMRQMVNALSASGGKREWIMEERSTSTVDQNLATGPIQPDRNEIAQNETAQNEIARNANTSSRVVIAEFMVDFVIEHTGYPREIVDMKADFEADLGLDSIKLAQLFGELRNNFDLPVAANDRSMLAKCRSLLDILDLFPKDNVVELSNSLSVEESSAVNYAKGLKWGQNHAMSIQSQLVANLDRLETTHADEILVSTLSEHSIPKTALGQWSHDDQWWQGASDGVGIDEQILLANLNAISQLLESSSNELPSVKQLDLPSSIALHDEVSEYDHDRAEDTSTSITQRYLLKMVDAPLLNRAPHKVTWRGAAVILGDNQVADELERSLVLEGVRCLRLDSSLPREQMVAVLDKAWKTEPILHAFLTMPHDASAEFGISSQHWKKRRQAGMMSAFWFCQEWLKLVIAAGKIQEASLIALTRLGGDFGFESPIIAPESGVLTGLLKAMVIENWVNGNRGLAVKIIDSGTNDPPIQIVDAVHREIANSSYDMEISWANGIRRVVRADLHPIRKLRNPPITRGGTWICTGGGRGITAFVAEQLALRYDLTLHLIGTAPVPNVRDEWRKLEGESLRKFKLSVMQDARNNNSNSMNPIKAWENTEKSMEIDSTLRRFKSLGIRAHYHSCDCSDPNQLSMLVSKIREMSGPIRGCLHGAGVGQDARFDRKRPDKVDQCLSAKIDGSLALMEATRNDPLQFFIGFGSISGRFGANGHTDYSMANDGLAKFIGWYRERRPDVRSVCFHWHAWGDVGMATKPETKLALEMIDMQFMPAREGMEHLIRELEGGAPQREVLITDDRYYRLFYPSETLLGNDTTFEAKTAFALLEPETSSCVLDPKNDVFLREHCLNDRPLLPMVIGLEAMVEAASLSLDWLPIQFGGPVIRVNQFESERGLRFFQDSPQTLELKTSVSSRRVCNIHLVSDFHARNGALVDPKRRYMRAEIVQCDGSRLLNWEPVDYSRLQWQEASYPPTGSAFFVGPAYRVLKQTCLRNDRIFGRIQSPSLIELAGTRRNVLGWRTPSAVLDACLFATGVLAWNHVQPGINLPVGIDSLVIHKMPMPGEMCLLESRFLRRDEHQAWFDFCVWGSDNTLRLEALSYRTAWLESPPQVNRY